LPCGLALPCGRALPCAVQQALPCATHKHARQRPCQAHHPHVQVAQVCDTWPFAVCVHTAKWPNGPLPCAYTWQRFTVISIFLFFFNSLHFKIVYQKVPSQKWPIMFEVAWLLGWMT
jgi:hypothetical protein